MKTLVLDSSSAILLFKVGLLSTLMDNYGILLASSVYGELTREGYPGAREITEAVDSGRCTVSPAAADGGVSAALLRLGAGERDTLCLYESGRGSFVVIDDRKGAEYCRRRNIPYINALLVPRILQMSGRLSETECGRRIALLLDLGRYAPRIVQYAAACDRPRLVRFMP